LQGLLLLNKKEMPKKFYKWSKVFNSLEMVSKKFRLSRYEICLRYVLSNPFIDKVLIGTDNFSQLKKLVNISKKGNIKIKNKDIKPSNDINLLNPSKWPTLV
jgi:aryl-alcohol dehydrogenase-like predicted oxidoreductase